MSTHTPGPWNDTQPRALPPAAGESYRIHAVQFNTRNNWNGYVADVLATSPNAEANARLIAAAPDLLAALKPMLTVADGLPLFNKELRDAARAAIQKAEG